MDKGNSPVTFQNMYVKLYNRPRENTIINNPEKTVDEKILMLFNHLEPEKSYQ